MSRNYQPRYTPKQMKFVREYLVDFNAGAAATRAKYSEHSSKSIGRALLQNPFIQIKIQEQLEKSMKESELTIQKVLSDIEELRELAKNDAKYQTALKASELQGKYLKMFVDRIEVKDNTDYSTMSDKELEKIAKGD